MTFAFQIIRRLQSEAIAHRISSSSSWSVVRFLSTANPNATSSEEQKESEQRSWSNFKPNFDFRSEDISKLDFRQIAEKAWGEVKEAVLPRTDNISATRVRTDATPFDKVKYHGSGHIVQAAPKETLFSKLMNRFHKQFEGNSVYMRLRGWTHQGKEMAEDFKDRMESSDHPMVHKIQDVHESFTREAEGAQVMREILTRDPDFKMVNFLRSIKEDVPIVVKAYLEGKEDVLRQHCSDELLERLMGLYRHAEAQGTFQDSTLLFINDVEMLDIMFVENQPVIVVTFSCQQINCMRDKFGNVIEGREDEIQQVYYAWALQQEQHGAFGSDGKMLPPRWQLREMMIRGFHALL